MSGIDAFEGEKVGGICCVVALEHPTEAAFADFLYFPVVERKRFGHKCVFGDVAVGWLFFVKEHL